jgi:hypothetical protein
MLDPHFSYTWRTLPNPFLRATEPAESITGHVSGRAADIAFLITGSQSAIILIGAPSIGKSTLIRYLKRSPDVEWSWRKELELTLPREQLNAIHFALVDLTPLEGIENSYGFLSPFIAQCTVALLSVYNPDEQQNFPLDLKGLRELLRHAKREAANTRFFLMIDTIEHLGKLDVQSSSREKVRARQERGLELLDDCGAIHILVDLMDEFGNFGVIFSIQSQPHPKIGDQFRFVSADLARFSSMILQSFTWEDTALILAQKAGNFGPDWAERFEQLGGDCIFSEKEQTWIREQAGTHPYLLQQYCFYTFRLKQELSSTQGSWTELGERARLQLTERMQERLSMFLTLLWSRLEGALEESSSETRSNFYDFIKLSTPMQAHDVIDPGLWDQLGSELRYILYSEGIVRHNQIQDIHFPGSLVRDFLVPKAEEIIGQPSILSTSPAPPLARGYWLRITRPGEPEERLSLTELEYRLLKTLIEREGHSTEADLMMAGWEKMVERSTFTQRMHHLRKKLKTHSGGQEIIENRYGGLYSLNYPEWFHLE